mmetsp:Transcript_9964/g.22234  ORF Transcript_9964/g.22234 Transcript_9964/m.22234 type:complete len:542 (-) Transcript_9964:103-1728(-)
MAPHRPPRRVPPWSRATAVRVTALAAAVTGWRGAMDFFCPAGTRTASVTGPSQRPRASLQLRRPHATPGRRAASQAGADEDRPGAESEADQEKAAPKVDVASKREMLRFALPALGIYLADPIMSNIDNGFVGRFGGTSALAALNPGTVVANNLLYLFSAILNSATTGLVARAWSDKRRGPELARRELARTVSFAWTVGSALTVIYLVGSPWALRQLGTPAEVIGQAADYARIRGLVSWAVLSQSVCLSALLATRDAVTPLRVVLTAALCNFAGDWLLCCWPFQWGVAGAAAATSISTLVGFCLMLGALSRKGIMPDIRVPRLDDAGPVLEYAGPLFVIISARVIGFSSMGITAATLGTVPLAAYQVLISIFVFFAFFAAPLSQTAQSMMPALIEAGDKSGARRLLTNLALLGSVVGAAVGVVSYVTLHYGARVFTGDAAVLHAIVEASPSACIAVSCLLLSSPLEGTLVAARDFSFIVPAQITASIIQLALLYAIRHYDLGLKYVLLTFAVRLVYTIILFHIRMLLGLGPLGKVLQRKSDK